MYLSARVSMSICPDVFVLEGPLKFNNATCHHQFCRDQCGPLNQHIIILFRKQASSSLKMRQESNFQDIHNPTLKFSMIIFSMEIILQNSIQDLLFFFVLKFLILLKVVPVLEYNNKLHIKIQDINLLYIFLKIQNLTECAIKIVFYF